ncbi:hypothetical protein BaRGS_00006152 [Batillaria attramentaria]|uniref:Uncharacterized protein n=1 Tax=Batillaria attramentaria TaxID=370345 RepID=A0ABD0LSY4_9CAEN
MTRNVIKGKAMTRNGIKAITRKGRTVKEDVPAVMSSCYWMEEGASTESVRTLAHITKEFRRITAQLTATFTGYNAELETLENSQRIAATLHFTLDFQLSW